MNQGSRYIARIGRHGWDVVKVTTYDYGKNDFNLVLLNLSKDKAEAIADILNSAYDKITVTIEPKTR